MVGDCLSEGRGQFRLRPWKRKRTSGKVKRTLGKVWGFNIEVKYGN